MASEEGSAGWCGDEGKAELAGTVGIWVASVVPCALDIGCLLLLLYVVPEYTFLLISRGRNVFN